MDRPETRYARSGDVSIAYQVFGEGPFDIVFVPPYVSNVELVWDLPIRAEGMLRCAEFARVIIFDKRGTGLSDRMPGAPPLEERTDDVRAVMDAAGSSAAAFIGVQEGAPMSLLFAATYPDRCLALVLHDAYARGAWAPDYDWAPTPQEIERSAIEHERSWGTPELASRLVSSLWPELEGAARDEQIAGMSRFQRHSSSPGAAAALIRLNAEIDVRDVLPSIRVPTLVLQSPADNERGRRDAEYLVSHIPGATPLALRDGGPAFFSGRLDERLADVRRFIEAAAKRPAGDESERVLATVLFTDIVDSTAKAVELGDREWRNLVSAHHDRVRAELLRFRGRELDTAGDGFFASFDGPARAIRCACAIRDTVASLGLDVRAGLHTGECEQIDGKVAGIAVVTGARIAALGGASDVLVSATVRDLVAGSGISFDDRGSFALKGLPEERRVYAVLDA